MILDYSRMVCHYAFWDELQNRGNDESAKIEKSAVRDPALWGAESA